MFSILLGKDDDYIDKQKQDIKLYLGDKERNENKDALSPPPFVSSNERMKFVNGKVYLSDENTNDPISKQEAISKQHNKHESDKALARHTKARKNGIKETVNQIQVFEPSIPQITLESELNNQIFPKERS